MKKSVFNTIFVAVATIALCSSCNGGNPEKRMAPVMKDYSRWTITGVGFNNSDFSGLDFNMDSTGFVGVFNSAGVYWIDLPADGDTLVHTRPLLAMDESSKIKRDLEAVCVDRNTGDFYLGQERKTVGKDKDLIYEGNTIYKLSAPEYTEQEKIVSFDTTLIQANNIGIEGLTILGDGHFIVGREGSRVKNNAMAPALIEWSKENGVISVTEMPDSVKQVAEVVYDGERECLWVTDSDIDKKLYMCTLTGEVVAEYDIKFIRNAEAICIDRSRGCIWIGSDEVPSKLYRIKFDNL